MSLCGGRGDGVAGKDLQEEVGAQPQRLVEDDGPEAVAGRPVRLFGVKAAPPTDRCALGQGDARNCVEVARDALAQRLERRPNVYCRVPSGQRAGEGAAICLDANGVDLGGFLVAEGLALADTEPELRLFRLPRRRPLVSPRSLALSVSLSSAAGQHGAF